MLQMPMFDNPFHQTAIFTSRPGYAVDMLMAMGYTEWKYDEADLIGHVHGEPMSSKGIMAFNYQFLQGQGELEILAYTGDNWHARAGRNGLQPFLSHMSVYVLDVDAKRDELISKLGWPVIQEFETHNHTSQYLIDNRKRFRECIFGVRDIFGFDIKLIQRLVDEPS